MSKDEKEWLELAKKLNTDFNEDDFDRMRFLGEKMHHKQDKVFDFTNTTMWIVIALLILLMIIGVFK